MVDLLGVGVGPFNLSVAALLHDVAGVQARFVDRKPAFSWHPGLLFDDAGMQTSYLKDLVTAVAPTSRFSFLNYLASQRKFYKFITASFPAVPRREFAQYLQWVSDQLPSLQFGVEVREISLCGDHFEVDTGDSVLRARHLCLGSGPVPAVPSVARPHLGATCFHALEVLRSRRDWSGLRVAVVGGGQSGAEVLLEALRERWGPAAHLTWISRRKGFPPLDESPFTNELFMPSYVTAFYGLDFEQRRALVEHQKLAGNGVSASTLQAIYQSLYARDPASVSLRPGRELLGLAPAGGGWRLTLENLFDGAREELGCDVVVLATGLVHAPPPYLGPLLDRLAFDPAGGLLLEPTFRVRWKQPTDNRIYAVNAGLHSHGIAEPQLSLLAWRSGTIINDLLGEERYDVHAEPGFVTWREPSPSRTRS
jgi:lysine N6-hydroxylase